MVTAKTKQQTVFGTVSRVRAAVNLGFQNADWNDISSIIISAIFLVLAIWRLLVLSKQSVKTSPYSTDTTKLVSLSIVLVLKDIDIDLYLHES
jgi:uncharacterized membrane protein